MKRIKTYIDFIKESTTDTSNDLKTLVSDLETEYPHCEFTVYNNSDSQLRLNIVYCPIEPEEGSYVHKTEIDVDATKSSDDLVTYKINLISGQYGCDEAVDDEWDIEPEFDYEISATSDEIDESNSTIQSLKAKLVEIIEEYCS